MVSLTQSKLKVSYLNITSVDLIKMHGTKTILSSTHKLTEATA